jgi:type II secretory pathway component PulK
VCYKKNNNRGLILIVALWIVAILALLAVGLGFRIASELHLVKFSRDNLKALMAAEAGVQLASKILSADINDYDSLNETWATGEIAGLDRSIFKDFPLKQATFSIEREAELENAANKVFYGLSDEDSKLNINKATTTQLEAFFTELGITNGREITNSILDWIDEDSTTSFDGAEDDYYTSQEPNYHCKNASLVVAEELLLIKGMDREKFLTILPFVTVYGDGKININTASFEVLTSLLISRGSLDTTARKLVKEIINYRFGEDAEVGTVDDRAFERIEDIIKALSSPLTFSEFAKCADAIKFKSEVFRANILASSSNKVAKKRISCLLKKDLSQIKGPEIILWAEQ